MKYHQIDFNYLEKKDFKLGLFSDLHIDDKYCKRDQLKEALQYAYDSYDGILLNGDVFSCLLPKDLTRFTLAHAIANRDDYLDYIIDYVTDFLAPYADKIKIIGMGNHEVSALKFHATNPAARLCRQLKEHGGNPQFGDYQNIVRLRFDNGSHVVTYNIWMCHGIGAGAKRSRGALEWDIVYSRFDANLYWMGHNHLSEIDNSGSLTYANKAGEILTIPKRGIRTPAWIETVPVRKAEDPYDIKYGEERYGTPTAMPGFGTLEIRIRSGKIKDRIYID